MFSDVRIMEISRRGEGAQFGNAVPVNFNTPKQYVDVPDLEHCAAWCVQTTRCYHFEYIAKTWTNPEGVCIMHFD